VVLYLIAGLFLLVLGLLLARAYRADRQLSTLVTGALFIAAAAFYSGFARSMIVYKPILVLHMALTLYSWYAVFLYLLKRRIDPYGLLAPLGSIALFFLVAYYFKEQ